MSYDLKNTSIGAYADIGSSSPQGSYLHTSVNKFAPRIDETGVGAYDRKNSTPSGISYEVPSSERHTIEAKVEGAIH
jgi:hypothetical protein